MVACAQLDSAVESPAADVAEEEEEEEDLLGFNLFESETPKVEQQLMILAVEFRCQSHAWTRSRLVCSRGGFFGQRRLRSIGMSWTTLCGTGANAVLEIGAGCGMVGVVAAKLGCERVVMTDRDIGALELI